MSLSRAPRFLRSLFVALSCAGWVGLSFGLPFAPGSAPSSNPQDDQEVDGDSSPGRWAINRSLAAFKEDSSLADLRWKAVQESWTPVLFENDEDGPPRKGRSSLERYLSDWLAVQRGLITEAEWLPESLQERAREQCIPVFVLTEAGQYDLVEPTFVMYSPDSYGAFYAPEVHAVLARSEDLENVRDAELRACTLRATAWAQLEGLLSRESEEGDLLEPDSWLWLGLSSHLSSAKGADAEGLAEPEVSTAALELLGLLLSDVDMYMTYWPRPQDLIGMRGRRGAFLFPRRFRKDASGQFGKVVFDRVLSNVSHMWVHFLLKRSPDGPAQMRAFIEQSVRNTPRGAAFGEAFGFETTQDAEGAFLEWWADRIEDQGIQVPLLPKVISGLEPTPWTEGPGVDVALAQLSVEFTAEDHLALQWGRAARGDLSSAAEDLASAVEEVTGAEDKARLGEAAEQLRALAAARDELIRVCIRDRKSLWVSAEGEEHRALPTEYTDGVIVFRSSKKHPIETVDVRSWGAQDLAKNLRKRSDRYGEPWVEALARCLAQDETWERALPDEAEAVAASWNPELVGANEACLGYLAGTSAIPESLEELRAWATDRAREAQGRGFPDRHRGPLEAKLRLELQRAVEDASLADLTAGKVESLGNDRYRFTHNFLSSDQLNDFHDEPEWFDDFRRQAALDVPLAPRRFISEGQLVMSGQRCLAHNFEFAPPLTLKTEVKFTGDEAGGPSFLVICGVEPNQYVRLADTVGLDVYAPKVGVAAQQALEKQVIQMETSYEVELTYDGRNLRYRREREDPLELRVKDLEGGQVLLWSHTLHRVNYKYLIVEGKLTAEGIERARERVLASALEEVGL